MPDTPHNPFMPPGAPLPGPGRMQPSGTLAGRIADLSDQRLTEWISAVLSTEAGSAILMTIISWGGIHQDAQLSDFDQGQRSLALKIVKLIGKSGDDAWAKELIKHAERKKRIDDEEEQWLLNTMQGAPAPRPM